jgi:hypothetical protein
MKKNSNLASLQQAFESRKKNQHYRASAVFPIFLTKVNDFFLVFFNYWTNKNFIKTSSLNLRIHIYDQDGNSIKDFNTSISKTHNQFSMHSILEKKYFKNFFSGTVFVEIISFENLSFPFPAIIGLYRSKNLYSSVHSAGRIKNLNEKHEIFYTKETNWSCKFEKGITPFFHYFVGPTIPKKNYITVSLLSSSKKIKKRKKINIKNLKPFSSRVFFIKKIFGNIKYLNSDFVSVEVEHNSTFPRMVVGNFHKKANFFETTHSFPFIKKKDYCPKVKDKEFQSKLSAYKDKDLQLDLKLFPTNCPGNFKGKIYKKKIKQNKLVFTGETIDYNFKSLSKTNILKLEKDDQILDIKMLGNKVPSRFNASFIYKVEGAKSNYSLDIADGARSCITPGKTSHWGHGYIGEKFETAIMIINDNHKKRNQYKANGELSIYSSKFKIKTKIKIEPDSIKILKISKMKKIKNLMTKYKFFSWFLKMKNPGCEAFWLSYRKKDGAIFGDHSF